MILDDKTRAGARRLEPRLEAGEVTPQTLREAMIRFLDSEESKDKGWSLLGFARNLARWASAPQARGKPAGRTVEFRCAACGATSAAYVTGDLNPDDWLCPKCRTPLEVERDPQAESAAG